MAGAVASMLRTWSLSANSAWTESTVERFNNRMATANPGRRVSPKAAAARTDAAKGDGRCPSRTRKTVPIPDYSSGCLTWFAGMDQAVDVEYEFAAKPVPAPPA